MKLPLMQGRPDDFQTPPEAITPILKYIPKEWTVWECAAGKGNLVKAFNQNGYRVISSDILTGENFCLWEPSEKYDVIITNPPFRYKQQFLERAYSLGKPFAFLLPLTTFETIKRQALFKKFGLEVVFLKNRINFETPSGKDGGSWFATAWFTNGLRIGNQLSWGVD